MKVDIHTVIGADYYFLLQATNTFLYGNLAFDVLDGRDDEINYVRNYAHKTGSEAVLSLKVHDWMTPYNGVLRVPVRAAVRAHIDSLPGPITLLDKMYAKVGLDAKTRLNKLYSQYLV